MNAEDIFTEMMQEHISENKEKYTWNVIKYQNSVKASHGRWTNYQVYSDKLAKKKPSLLTTEVRSYIESQYFETSILRTLEFCIFEKKFVLSEKKVGDEVPSYSCLYWLNRFEIKWKKSIKRTKNTHNQIYISVSFTLVSCLKKNWFHFDRLMLKELHFLSKKKIYTFWRRLDHRCQKSQIIATQRISKCTKNLNEDYSPMKSKDLDKTKKQLQLKSIEKKSYHKLRWPRYIIKYTIFNLNTIIWRNSPILKIIPIRCEIFVTKMHDKIQTKFLSSLKMKRQFQFTNANYNHMIN